MVPFVLALLALALQEPPRAESQIAVGARVAGALPETDGSARSEQRFVLTVAGAEPLTITLESYDFDAVLRVEDEAGKLIAEDDDSGVELDARVVISLAAGSACRLVAQAKKGAGEFVLAVSTGELPTPSASAELDLGIAWRHRAAERARARGDLNAATRHLLEEGNRRTFRSQYGEAREVYERSLELAHELEDLGLEQAALGNLGMTCFYLSDYACARERWEQCLEVSRQRGDRASIAKTLGYIGTVHHVLGDHARARDHYQQYLDLSIEAADREGEAEARGRLGILEHSLGNYAVAAEHLERSGVLSREAGDTRAALGTLGNLGATYQTMGDYLRARDCYEQYLTLAREQGSRLSEGLALGNLGQIHHALGDYRRAREHYQQCTDLMRELGNRAEEAKALGCLAGLSYDLADYASARELYEHELAVARELGNRELELAALNALGLTYLCFEDLARAQDCLEQSLTLAQDTGDKAAEAGASIGLGHLHRARGDHQRARVHHERVLVLTRELGDRGMEARALEDLGSLHLKLGECSQASALLVAAHALAKEIGALETRLSALSFSLTSSICLSDAVAARTALAEAEELIDGQATVGLEAGEASGLRSRYSELCQGAQDLAALRLAQAGPESAERDSIVSAGFVAAGRWKGRGLLEGMAEHRAGARSAEALELRRLRREALALHSNSLQLVSQAIQAGKPSAEVAVLRERAHARRAEADRLAARLQQVSPRDAALDMPLGARPEEVRRAVLAPGDLLIEYVEGSARHYAYVLGAERLEFLDLGPTEALAAELTLFLGGIREPTALADAARVATAGKALFERLLAPALRVASVERLVIVPSALLAGLPFEALVVEAQPASAAFADIVFVLDRYEVTYGPSSPVLVELAGTPRRAERGPLLVLADPRYSAEPSEPLGPAPVVAAALARARPEPARMPRLPGTREEAFSIARALAGVDESKLAELHPQRSGSLADERIELHLGESASRARLAGDLRRYSALHLACHGFVDAELPQRTGIALSPQAEDDGYFTIQDALELDLDCELVVLSACQTAQGRSMAGEGVESLARAFLYAGARGLVASLWSVDDRAAARTMASFYEGWLDEGRTPASALRRAKLALRRGEVELGSARGIGGTAAESSAARGPGHPYFWAPFIHVGLGR